MEGFALFEICWAMRMSGGDRFFLEESDTRIPWLIHFLWKPPFLMCISNQIYRSPWISWLVNLCTIHDTLKPASTYGTLAENFAGFSFMNANNTLKTNLYAATSPRLFPGNQKHGSHWVPIACFSYMSRSVSVGSAEVNITWATKKTLVV